MNERIFKTMSRAGAVNLVIGIVALVMGVIMGTLLIVSGAKLMKRKHEITF